MSTLSGKTVHEDESGTVAEAPEGLAETEITLPDNAPSTSSAVPAAMQSPDVVQENVPVPPEQIPSTATGSPVLTTPAVPTVSPPPPEEILADMSKSITSLKDNLDFISARSTNLATELPVNYLDERKTGSRIYTAKDALRGEMSSAIRLMDTFRQNWAILDCITDLTSSSVVRQASSPDGLSDVSEVSSNSSVPLQSTSAVGQTAPETNILKTLETTLSNMFSILGPYPSQSQRQRIFQSSEMWLRYGIHITAQYINTLPEDDVTYPFALSNLGIMSLYLYEITWDYNQLTNGVLAGNKAILKWSLLPIDYTKIATSAAVHRAWAYGLRLFFRKHGNPDMIKMVLGVLKTSWDVYKILVIDGAPMEEKINGQSLREELGTCLLEHYRYCGQIEYLNESIEHLLAGNYLDDVIGTGELDDPVQSNLGMAYLYRFLHCGNVEDLHIALRLGQNSMESHPKLSRYNNNDAARNYLFSMALVERFKVTSKTPDLDKAVEHCRKAITLAHPSHPLLPQYRSSLAVLLRSRYEVFERIEDLHAALEAINIAVTGDITNVHEQNTYVPVKAIQGYLLSVSGKSQGDVAVIEDGIRLISRARRDYCGPVYLESHIEHYLSRAVLCLFSVKKDKEALVTAVHHASLAFDKALDNSPHRFKYGLDLGSLLFRQHQSDLSSPSCDDALALFCWVSMSPTWPSIRLEATLKWANAAEASNDDPQIAHDALAMAVDIIPSLASLQHRMSIQHKILSSQNSAIPNRAAAYAIDEGDMIKTIRYLEKGRNILWAQALNLRLGHMLPSGDAREHEFKVLSRYVSEVRHIESSFPSNVEDFEERVRYVFPGHHGDLSPEHLAINHNVLRPLQEVASSLLTTPQTRHDGEATDNFTHALALRAQSKELHLDFSLHDSGKRWYDLLSTFPDLYESLSFSDKQRADLVPIVAKGPIIAISAHGLRCDAVIISSQSDAVDISFTHVPLPEMSGDEIQAWAETLREGMYKFYAGDLSLAQYEEIYLIPILRGLWKGLACPILDQLGYSPTGDVKRIWWYPTGPLMFLPIHAASPCEEDKPGLLDFIISSYTPSIYSLIRASKSPQLPLKILAVGLPDTPGQSSLPYVRKEINELGKHFKDSPENLVTLIGEEATIYPVLSSLKSQDFTGLHLSCHAYQDEEYPFNSAFFLHNGKLKLSKLMDVDLSRVQFAFLSACLTSAGNPSLPDECIHLAAAMQFAGVRSVIATMSSVNDRFSAGMASMIYKYLLRNGIDNADCAETAEALFVAIKETRKRKIPLAYVYPYIHLGI